jgi:hypothetical protein
MVCVCVGRGLNMQCLLCKVKSLYSVQERQNLVLASSTRIILRTQKLEMILHFLWVMFYGFLNLNFFEIVFQVNTRTGKLSPIRMR